MTPQIDPRLGRSQVSFVDPRRFGWPVITLGGALACAGLLIGGLLLAEPPHYMSDALGLGAFVAFLALGGLVALGLGVAEMVRGPRVWHLCDHGLVRTAKAGDQDRLVMWRDVPRLDLVEVRMRGVTLGYRLAGLSVSTPPVPRDVAQRGVALWRAAQPVLAVA